MAGAALADDPATGATGYVLICLVGAAVYLVGAFAVCVLHAVEASRVSVVAIRRAVGKTVRAPLLVSALGIPPVVVGIARFAGCAAGAFDW